MPASTNREDDRIEQYTETSALRSLWESWQVHPNADFDFFSTIVKSRPSVVKPVILVLHRKGIPVALAAGRLENAILPISLGYLKVSHTAIRQLTIVYGGLMGEWDESGAAVLIHHLRRLMRREHIDAVHLPAMRHDHALYMAAHKLLPSLLRDRTIKDNPHWWVDLPEGGDGLLSKTHSKHRTALKSKERKLLQFSGGAVEDKVFQAPQEVSAFCTIAENIARATYLRGLGEGFIDSPEMRNRLDLAAQKGWMRGYVLYANQKPCAFWLGTLYQKVFYLDYTGYDSAFKEYAVGQILFIKMIERLCAEGSVRSIDFGFGDAEYKQRNGDRSWKESDLYLFSTTPRMLVANAARKTVALVRTIAKSVLQRTALTARVKKRWRLLAEKSARRPAPTHSSTSSPVGKDA